MGSKLSNWSNIGTFVLTAIILVIMWRTMPQTADSATQSGSRSGNMMSAWIMPSILAVSLVIAGILHVVASRGAKSKPEIAQRLSDGTAHDREHWPDAFRKPQWTKVSGREFLSEEVVIDGKIFDKCSFTNVKLVYHGLAPSEFRDCRFDTGLVFTTDNPAVMHFANLRTVFSAVPGARSEQWAADEKGHPLRPQFSILEVPSSQDKDSGLRARTIALCDELKMFLREYGPKPEIEREPGEDAEALIGRKWDVKDKWKSKMGAEFRLRFSDSVRRIRDELEARSGFSESTLDDAIASAESQICEPKTIEEMRKHLWNSALMTDR